MNCPVKEQNETQFMNDPVLLKGLIIFIPNL